MGESGTFSSDHFRIATANRHQLDQPRDSLSALNALSLSSGMPWEEAYRLLLQESHLSGFLPDEPFNVRQLLKEAGYVPVPFESTDSCDELAQFLRATYPSVTCGIAKYVQPHSSKEFYAAVRRLETGEFAVMDTLDTPRTFVKLCLPSSELGIPPLHRTVLEDRSPSSCMEREHLRFHFFQPNPHLRSTGDCVIRAYCAVFERSWHEIVDLLAESCEYMTTRLNDVLTYRYLTRDFDLTYHEPILIGGKRPRGKTFCAYLDHAYLDGERIFAILSPSHHVVGIVPVDTPEGKRYSFLDSWDSTENYIQGFYIYRPKKQQKISAPPAPMTGQIQSGMTVRHPSLGTGTVQDVDTEKGRIRIVFAGGQSRLLLETWVREHCEIST
ncbi:MAG: hypothetical protein IJ083_17795 [Clostridia bacterium]|nr:hypothetical protein [Clostridia bacterium]